MTAVDQGSSKKRDSAIYKLREIDVESHARCIESLLSPMAEKPMQAKCVGKEVYVKPLWIERAGFVRHPIFILSMKSCTRWMSCKGDAAKTLQLDRYPCMP